MPTSCRRSRLILCAGIVFLAACGASLQPNVTTSDHTDPRLGPGTGRPTRVVPGVEPRSPGERGKIHDEVCRARPLPSGWIAIRYTAGGERCPKGPDGNPYTRAVIERHRGRAAGTVIVICADQGTPRGWVRERSEDLREGCPGARVRAGAATAVRIRRIG